MDASIVPVLALEDAVASVPLLVHWHVQLIVGADVRVPAAVAVLQDAPALVAAVAVAVAAEAVDRVVLLPALALAHQLAQEVVPRAARELVKGPLRDNVVRAQWPVGHRVPQHVRIHVAQHVMPHVKEAA